MNNDDNTSPQLKQCGGCGQFLRERPSTRLLRCSRCKVAYYCNVQCQRRAYLRHKAVCYNASELPPLEAAEMHAHHQQQAQRGGQRVFKRVIDEELRLQQPLCLWVADVNNAADSMTIVSHDVIRSAMWPTLSQAQRDAFEQHCAQHGHNVANRVISEVHIVYLDTNAQYFRSTLNPVTTQPSPPPPASPQRPTVRIPVAERPSAGPSHASAQTPLHPRNRQQNVEQLVDILSQPDYVERVLDMELANMLSKGHQVAPDDPNRMAIAYLSQIIQDANVLFGQGTDATRRAIDYATQKLEQLQPPSNK